ANGLTVAVATGDGEVDVERADEMLSRPTAWVFGNEAHGVPPALAEAADARVRIPIRGRAESLNIVTAASICLHTDARLRARHPGARAAGRGTSAAPRSRRERWWRGRVRFDTRGGHDDREVAVQRARARGG